jgi:hypothetical protein
MYDGGQGAERVGLGRRRAALLAGGAFLLTMVLGHLPALFALPAGLGDIATGIAAPLVARRLAQGAGRRAAVWLSGIHIFALGIGPLSAHGTPLTGVPR